MIPELGQYAIILALCVAFLQIVFPVIGLARNNTLFLSMAKYTARTQFLLIGLAFFALGYSFLVNDFSVAYVAENSNTHLPAIYRFCAIWGAHEGSMLLWVFVLTIWMALVSVFSRRLPLHMLARVLVVLACIAIGFYLFILLTSDPFLRFLPNIPVQGADLNPILQDPGLVAHPPMLYMGYVGFSVAFAFAMAALWSRQLDAKWAHWTRPWTQMAWCFLTLGIVLGSWWSYRELGWGGFWFWDPVENASFLPWLVGTALIHSLAVTEKRDVFKAWTVLLAMCAFSLSLLGTFIVRSGVLISVHAFAVDPSRGEYMLQFLLCVVGSALVMYAWRGKHIINTGRFHMFSRESFVLANNVFLFVAMVTILLGTLYPIFMEVLGLGKISVGAPYFNEVFVPLMIPVLLLMAVGPLCAWDKMCITRLRVRLVVCLLIALVAAGLLPYWSGVPFVWAVFIGLALSFWVILHMVLLAVKPPQAKSWRLPRLAGSQWGMLLAHCGMGVCVIGLVLNTAYSQTLNLSMQLAEKVTIAHYQLQLKDVYPIQGPNYTGYEAAVGVRHQGELVATLHPQQRDYSAARIEVAKTDIAANAFRDIYVALGDKTGAGAWGMRIYYKPFVRWIWLGGLLMVLGGLCAALDKRYRSKRQVSNET